MIFGVVWIEAIFDAFNQYFIDLFACALSFNYLNVDLNNAENVRPKVLLMFWLGVGVSFFFVPSNSRSLFLSVCVCSVSIIEFHCVDMQLKWCRKMESLHIYAY